MVEAKMLDWFDYRSWFQLSFPLQKLTLLFLEFKLYQWLRTTTLDRLILGPTERTSIKSDQPEIWKERKEAENALRDYLADIPSCVKCMMTSQPHQN